MSAVITKIRSTKNMFIGEVVRESIDSLFLDFDNQQLRGKGIVVPWSQVIGGYKLIGINALLSEKKKKKAKTLVFDPFERKLYEFRETERAIGWKERYGYDGIIGIAFGSRTEKYIGWTTSQRKDWNPLRDCIQEWYMYKGTAQDLIEEMKEYSRPA